MKTSLLKCLYSFRFAWKGITYTMIHENNMRYHALATIVVIAAGWWLEITTGEWVAILICTGLVWMAELFNTAIEKLVDLVSPQFNEKAGLVKDIASGAVLVTAITALVIAGIVFFHHLWHI